MPERPSPSPLALTTQEQFDVKRTWGYTYFAARKTGYDEDEAMDIASEASYGKKQEILAGKELQEARRGLVTVFAGRAKNMASRIRREA